MKTLPINPYLQNIVRHYRDTYGLFTHGPDGTYELYRPWLAQFGFVVPVRNKDQLEFPDDFSDRDLMMFILRWS